MLRRLLPSAFLLALLASGCKKENIDLPTPLPTSTPLLRISHMVDGQPLSQDTLAYTNEAGTPYSVTRLEYYLSELVLLGTGNTANDTLHGPWYVNADGTMDFGLDRLHTGTYSGATLLLGLPPALNTTGALPNTMANLNMAWPDPMGGGYHFIKFEGHFISAGTSSGYAMHIGTDTFLPHCTLPEAFNITSTGGKLLLTFNLNEVFRTPNTYDLATGNYSMGNMGLMTQLQENCADAFTIAYQP